MEEICSMRSVKQGRGPRGTVSCCPGMFSGFNMTESQAWLDVSVDPALALSRRLDCKSLWRAPSFLEYFGINPSGWGGYMDRCMYIVPGWNDLLSNGLNTETAFPFQQGLELCTPSSNFWSLAFINFRDPYFTPGVCVVSRRFLANIVFTLR